MAVIKRESVSRSTMHVLDSFINSNGINNPPKRIAVRNDALEIKKAVSSQTSDPQKINSSLKELKIHILDVRTKWKQNRLLKMFEILKEKLLEENIISSYTEEDNENEDMSCERIFTLSELKYYNGMRNRPLYVCVDRIVYDLSSSKCWSLGSHFGLLGGRDLTRQFHMHHSKTGTESVLKRYNVVGKLEKSEK